MKPKTGNIIVYIVLLFVVIIMMIFLKRGSHENTDDKLIGNTINIAIEYSPLALYTYDDTLGGFCYDFMRMVEGVSHHKFKFHPIVSLERTLTELDNGMYDMVIAQFPTTKENKNKYLFSEALYIDQQVLVQQKDSLGEISIKSQLDLANDTVYIVKGSPMRSRLASLSREIGETIYVAEDVNYGPEQLFLRTATGEIKYSVINEKIAAMLSQRYPNIDYSTKISFSQFQPVIMRSTDTTLCDSLNLWIDIIKQSPEGKALQSRYF